MKTKDISQIVVGVLVMLSFMVVLWAVFKIEMPATNRDLALILLGVLASKFGDVVAYHFNSSKGSSEKTDIISKLPPVSVLLILILVTGLVSCSTPQKMVAEIPVQYKERIVERLVPVELPADSAILSALFSCDSTNQVILRELSDSKTRGQSQASFIGGKLTYKLITLHDTIYMKADSVFIEKDKIIKVPVEVKVNELTKWQGFQIVGFRVMAVALLLWLFLKYWKTKISTVFKTLFKGNN